MTNDEKKLWLNNALGREIEVSKVQIKGELKYLVDYINYAAPVRKLMADTPEGAVDALYEYLSKTANSSETSV